MQGISYWPTAKGQSLDLAGVRVSLEDVTCTVHWTERKLALSNGKTVLNVTHYQINVFPAKISCSPLVLLCDRVLASTFSGRLSNQLRGACVQCGAGAGRSALLAILLVAMCQVRAGDVRLCGNIALPTTSKKNIILQDGKRASGHMNSPKWRSELCP
ncbi:hypothetical protein RR48_01055 [Papilio machaon]|uniref:Tyrosine-protein phosphatase domain-containing protein n=1 Tax=Papilio machaon TaxID=76193 RepID=A0A0N1IHG4_PAPMA|nr:hypothetical protein RR48_01055 [Papilio machaon]